jgi:hypothetical protein
MRAEKKRALLDHLEKEELLEQHGRSNKDPETSDLP